MPTLTSESALLVNTYNKLNKIKCYRSLTIANKNTNHNLYNKFQKHNFKILNTIYNNEYNNLSNINSTRTSYNSHSLIYKKLVYNIYNNHLENNKYIDSKINAHIISEPGNLLKYNILIASKTITINIIKYSDKLTRSDYIKFDKLVKKIVLQIHLISNLTSATHCCNNSFNIYLFLTPFKRELTYNEDIVLGEKHANGGFCYGCMSECNIIIYREQEVFKVLTHELLHTFGIDKSLWRFNRLPNANNNDSTIYNKFLDNFNLSQVNDLAVNECLVEFWATFLNSVLYSFLYVKETNLSNFNKQTKLYNQIFEKVIKYEILHSIMQTAKILNYNKCKYSDIFNKKSPNMYRESTHIFSYYILKLGLLFDYERFINTQISILPDYGLKFNESLKNSSDFFNYLIVILKNKHLKTNIDSTMNLYVLIRQKNSKYCEFLINNLRMTVLEYY